MFDDLKQQNNQSASVPQNPNALPQNPPPSMAPVQPLADMFADVDPVAQGNQNTAVKPSAVQSGKIKPVSSTTFAPSQPSAPTDALMFSETSSNKLNKIIIILVVVLLVLAMGAGAYYMIVVKGKIKTPVNTNQNTNQTDNTNTDNNENTDEVDTTDSDADGLTDMEESEYNTNALLADTDGDTLSDREEVKTYKTDPLVMDTDIDGLNDGEEINVWSTNPLLADTDNDGYPDGTEVKNGYSPIGPGKLSTSAPGVTTEEPVNIKLSTAMAWGSNLISAVVLCADVSNQTTLTSYLAGTDICSSKINQVWPIAPDSFPKVCVLDKIIQDTTWSVGLQSNSPETLNSVICTQDGCAEASLVDYPEGKVCPQCKNNLWLKT